MTQIPYNEDFERAVLVGILQDPLFLPKISSFLSPEDFYKESHKRIYSAILDLGPDNLDSLAVEDKLSGNESTKEYFQSLVQESDRILPSLSNLGFYAETIKGKARLRAGIDLGREIAATCYAPNTDPDEAIAALEAMFAEFLQDRVLDNKIESTQSSFKKFIESLSNKIEDTSGIKTGFRDVDLMLHRLEGLIILAARPSMGKTALCINIARNVAEERPVLFCSVEQSQEQVFERMLSSEAEVPLEEIRTGAFINNPVSVDKIEQAKQRLGHVYSRLHIDENAAIPTSYIASLARQKKYEWGDLGLIVVDYLHILRLNNKQQTDALGDAVKDLRALGKELGCPVLLLSQLNRQNEQRTEGKVKNRRPNLVDLRGSGDIEQSADIVLFLYRDSYYQPSAFLGDVVDIAEIIIAKNRNGRQGIVTLEWEPEYVRFKNPVVRRR